MTPSVSPELEAELPLPPVVCQFSRSQALSASALDDAASAAAASGVASGGGLPSSPLGAGASGPGSSTR